MRPHWPFQHLICVSGSNAGAVCRGRAAAAAAAGAAAAGRLFFAAGFFAAGFFAAGFFARAAACVDDPAASAHLEREPAPELVPEHHEL